MEDATPMRVIEPRRQAGAEPAYHVMPTHGRQLGAQGTGGERLLAALGQGLVDGMEKGASGPLLRRDAACRVNDLLQRAPRHVLHVEQTEAAVGEQPLIEDADDA